MITRYFRFVCVKHNPKCILYRSPLLTQCLYEALRVVKHTASDKSPFNCTMALNKTLNQSKNLSKEPTNIEPSASLKSPRNINLFSNHSLSSLFALSSAWSSSLCSRILFNTSSLASCNLKKMDVWMTKQNQSSTTLINENETMALN